MTLETWLKAQRTTAPQHGDCILLQPFLKYTGINSETENTPRHAFVSRKEEIALSNAFKLVKEHQTFGSSYAEGRRHPPFVKNSVF